MSDNEEKKDLVQGWLDRQALNAIKMSEDDNYRQLVKMPKYGSLRMNRLKRDASQFNKRPIREYLEY